jgi:prepilin-type N-terminal cleavage/methylation domain-containing protein
MHRTPSHSAFTLIEMITVIAIIAILSGLVLSIAGSVQQKGYRAKADGDIKTMSAACEAYKTDNGGYPQDIPSTSASGSVTSDLDPKTSGNPTVAGYQASSLFLYKQLSGDDNANGKIDASETGRRYCSDFFKTSRFDSGYKNTGNVSYVVDPFGYSYGYSTAALKAEQDYRVVLETTPNAARPVSKGYNPTFDIWSTGGTTTGTDSDRAKWLKNW